MQTGRAFVATLALSIVAAPLAAEPQQAGKVNQGLTLGDALHRCHALDGQGLYWFEEPITYNNLAGYVQLTREPNTPVQLGENFYGPRELFRALEMGAGDYVMPDLMRIAGVSGWLRARICRRRSRRRGVESPIPGSGGPSHACHRDGALAGVAGLGGPGSRRAVQA